MNGTRIRQAREICGKSVEELAGTVGCTPQQLNRYEANLESPPWMVAQRIYLVTGFRPKFFEQTDPPGFPLGSLLYHTLPRRCSVCRKQPEDTWLLCDLCDAPLCDDCAVKMDGDDYCPTHKL